METENHIDEREIIRRDLCISSLDNTFTNFEVTSNNKKAFDTFLDFATFEKPVFVGCYGGVGCGKTHLLEATSIELYKQRKFARVIQSSIVFQTLKNALANRSTDTYDAILERYCNAPVLLLDDYGAGIVETKWTNALLEQMIIHRYHFRLKTALITNLDFHELPERVVSRFTDKELSRLVLIKEKDYRGMKNGNH